MVMLECAFGCKQVRKIFQVVVKAIEQELMDQGRSMLVASVHPGISFERTLQMHDNMFFVAFPQTDKNLFQRAFVFLMRK
jgi:hypothetical protein